MSSSSKLVGFVLLGALSLFASEPNTVPGIDELMSRMKEQDTERMSALAGYTAQRRYKLENKTRKASMLVRMTCLSDGRKQFEVLEEEGSGSVRKHVFRRMLDEESNASRPGSPEQSRVNQQNYSLRVAGTEILNGRPAYVIEAEPKKESKYLIAGKIWVDREDYAIVRVEGRPAKNPSFWTRSVHFVHTCERKGSFWFPVSNQSVSDVRVFGKAELTIEYFDYQTNTKTTLLRSASRREALP